MRAFPRYKSRFDVIFSLILSSSFSVFLSPLSSYLLPLLNHLLASISSGAAAFA